MTVETGTATHLGQQAAAQNQLLKESYLKKAPMSTKLKLEIGELLFCLEFPIGQRMRSNGWRLLEKMLRSYVDLQIMRVKR